METTCSKFKPIDLLNRAAADWKELEINMDKSGDIVARTQYILNMPLGTASIGLDKLVNESSPQELLPCLEHIVDVVFGTNARWNLRSINHRSDAPTFEALRAFLHPTGPVFKLIYKLVVYWDSKTVYNLTEYLVWVRDLFEDVMPEYFMDKVSVDDQTRRITHMSLNAFELYMLHFAYYLVNPWMPKAHDSFGCRESLYMQLCMDYLSVFLPCEGYEVLPHVPVNYSSLRSTLPRHNQASYRPDPKPTIFRQSLFCNASDTPQQPYKHNIHVWRSEAVIYIFSYVWLNYGKQDVASCTIIREPPPSVDHVRVVRTMVKHFHYFANSAIGDTSSLDTLKRIVRPMCGDKIYRFLRRSVYNWPQDSSFRLILEAWLSYIQPWRYTDFLQNRSQSNVSQNDTIKDRPVDRIWQPFIADNLFTYTIIYQQVLPRFMRLDLTTMKNVFMLHRVTKVFSQQHLNVMIAEVECCLRDQGKWENNQSDLPQYPVAMMDGRPVSALVETSQFVVVAGKHWNAVLRQKLLNLEGYSYDHYAPMFQNDVVQVHSFLDMVMAAYISDFIYMMSAESQADCQWSIFTIWKLLFTVDSRDMYGTTLEDRRRVVMLLEQTLRFIALIYNVPVPVLPDVRSLCAPVSASTSSSSQAPSVTKVSPELWQVRLPPKQQGSGLSYQGDPDLLPIMSNECAFLVRMLYKVASKLNSKYSLEMNMLFNQPGFIGGVARQILSPPKLIHYYDKSDPSKGYAPWVENMLPARLSLRWLASYRMLSFVTLLLAVSYLMYGSFTMLIIGACGLWLLYLALRALCEPLLPIVRPERTEPASELDELFNLDTSS